MQPLQRKLKYLATLASPEGVDLAMRKMAYRLPVINLNITYAVLFRLLLDLYLHLNLHFDFSMFEWHPIDFTTEFTIELPKVEKAKYGESKYDFSIYDPENVNSLSLERMVWDLRKKSTSKDHPSYRQTGEALKKHFEIIKDALVKKEVREEYIDAMIEHLMLVEGLLVGGAFVGFSIVGFSKVMPKPSSLTSVTVRDPQDLKTERKIHTDFAYGSYVGYARVGYARVGRRPGDERFRFKRELQDYALKAIEEFRKREGPVGPPGLEILHRRLFMLQRTDRYHYYGGYHQIKLQRINNAVKQVLDRYGVVAQMRMTYISFAKELAYLYHDSHRRYKRWKKILTEDDLIEKYKRMGLDEDILREIVKVVRTI